MHARGTLWVLAVTLIVALGVRTGTRPADDRPWEAENPVRPLAAPPLGIEFHLKQSKDVIEPARVRLGRWLFYDARISVDGTIACASCHRPEYGFADVRQLSPGIQGRVGTRKTPSLLNQAMSVSLYTAGRAFFAWDGRSASIEEQLLRAVDNPREMGNAPREMIRRLSAIGGYRPYFKDVFGTEEINDARVAQAIADYVRTRASGNSAYDRWNGGDNNALSATARRGQELFFEKANCAGCHLGSNFTSGNFASIGIGWDPVTKTFKDDGRFVVTKNPRDRGQFKIPGLRDVSRRAPYMHDGSIATLRDVILFYNKTRKLELTEPEVTALVAFLQSLDGEGYLDTAPKVFPR